MKKYNLFILLPNIADEEVDSARKQIEEIISKVGGKIISTEEFGKRKLSYAIKKVRHGFYLDYVIEIELEKINKLKKELKLNQEILRFEISNYLESKIVKKTSDRKTGNKEIREKKKVSMEELNERLDNILETKNI